MKPPGCESRPIQQILRRDPPLSYERLSDPVLVKRAKDGDRRALDALCERHAPRVERLARHLLDDREDARDAAQESLAKLCTRLSQYRGEAAFATWLHRLVVNTCRDAAERQRVRRCDPLGDELELRASPYADPARAADLAELRSELRSELRGVLAGISADQARVVVLKDGFDLSFEEIAAAAGMPVGTAKCYAHRGRNRLRRRLEDVA